MLLLEPFSAILLTVAFSICVKAETHTIVLTNNCGSGTPTLIQGPVGSVLSTGETFVSNGPLTSVIAFLQTGSCGINGENCTLVETTLVNPDPATLGSGSSTDISLIAPHKFSVSSAFKYFNGCDGTGSDCTSPSCTPSKVACDADDANLAITFCPSGSELP